MSTKLDLLKTRPKHLVARGCRLLRPKAKQRIAETAHFSELCIRCHSLEPRWFWMCVQTRRKTPNNWLLETILMKLYFTFNLKNALQYSGQRIIGDLCSGATDVLRPPRISGQTRVGFLGNVWSQIFEICDHTRSLFWGYVWSIRAPGTGETYGPRFPEIWDHTQS